MASSAAPSLAWIKNPHRAATVEIVIFLYIAGVLLENPIMQQYLYERAKMDLNIKGNHNDTVCNGAKYINQTRHR